MNSLLKCPAVAMKNYSILKLDISVVGIKMNGNGNKTFDLYLVNLDTTMGREIQKTRRVLYLSPMR
jgi:hypothetical protein